MDHSGWPAREVQRSGYGGGSCSGYWPNAPASPPGQSARRHWRNDDGCAGGDRRAGGGGQWGSWGRDQAASPGSPETMDPAWARWQPSTGKRSSDEEEAQEERGSYMAPKPKLVPRRATGPPASYAPGLVDFEAWAEAEVPDDIYKGLEETRGIDETDLKLVSGMCAVLLPGGRCSPGSQLCVLAYELNRSESDIWRVVVASVGRFGRKFGASEDPWGRVWVYPRNVARCRYRAARQGKGAGRCHRGDSSEGSDGDRSGRDRDGGSSGPAGRGSDGGGGGPDHGAGAAGGCGGDGAGGAQQEADRPGLVLAAAPGPPAAELDDDGGDPPSFTLSPSPVAKRERSRSGSNEPCATVTFGGMLEDPQAAGPAQAAAGAEVRAGPPPAPAPAAPASVRASGLASTAPSDGAVSLEEEEDLLVQFDDIWSIRDAATDAGSVGGRSSGP